jgi:hypothetical protein
LAGDKAYQTLAQHEGIVRSMAFCFLLRIGDGTEKSIGQDYVCLPKEIIIGLHRILGIITAKQGFR